MRDLRDLRAAVVGTGFIGVVHVEALRRLGIEVVGVVGSTPDRARAKATEVPLAEPYESFEAMLGDDRVDVVHVTTPNYLHYPHAKSVLEAGKHVVCEKPLGLDAAESAELFRLAEESGRVHCTNFNIRFYPQPQQARALVSDGALGDVWNVHGAYLQDWLQLPTDWNWRLEPDKGGELRAVADIGSHWLDLAEFVAGVPITEVSAGRKNSLRLELDGSAGALAWDSEQPEELWLGHRQRANETLLRDPGLFEPAAAARTSLPAGHAEGFADTFKELYRAVYSAVASGAMPAEPEFPSFAAGLRENVIGEAVARSAAEGRW